MRVIKVIAYFQFIIVLGIVLGFYIGSSKYWVPFDLAIIVILFVCGIVLLNQKPTSHSEINPKHEEVKNRTEMNPKIAEEMAKKIVQDAEHHRRKTKDN